MKQALALLKEISSHQYEAYLVGGFVRDHYLGRENLDIDICTSAPPEFIKENFQVTLDHSQYGSVTIIYEGKSFEITTFRKDIYQGNRYPQVLYVKTLQEDLHRRDFTINTLCIDQDGNYVDLLHAKADLDQKIIRMVGDPYIKIQEDPLRMLRALRFQVLLSFHLEETLEQALIESGHLLKSISHIRIQKELNKCPLEAREQLENLLIRLDFKRYCE